MGGNLETYAPLLRRGVRLAEYTTFEIGGPAELLAEVGTIADLVGVARAAWADGVKVIVLGEGSNVLVGDEGVDGLIVVNRCRGIQVEGMQIVAEAGARLNEVIDRAIAHGLTGMELMVGIPGTVGGAVVGNAGAYGQSISGVLAKAKVLSGDGRVEERPGDTLGFAYRTSRLKQSGEIVLAAEFSLAPGAPGDLRNRADEVLAKRRTKLPPGSDCAGSYFKNIEDPRAPNGKIPAGQLLDAVGAKSFRVGQAAVSRDHANVIINLGGATAADVLAIAGRMKHAVKEKFGVELEEEVRFLSK